MTILRNKTVTKILSVLVAIALWAYVIGVQNADVTRTINNIPIEILNAEMLASDGFILTDVDRQAVNITVSGSLADIIQFQDQFTAIVNVFGHGLGSSRIGIEMTNPAPGRLEILSVTPSNTLITVENLVAIYMPIDVVFTGEIHPNTEPGQMTLQPERIEIIGPQSMIETVTSARVEVYYPFISRMGTAFSLPVSVLNADGEPVENVSLSSEMIGVEVAIYDTRVAPLEVELVGEVGEAYEITRLDIPSTITVRGNIRDINNIEVIRAEPIDISNIQITSDIRIRPILPPDVEAARGFEMMHVRIGIAGILTETFDYSFSRIEVRGLDEGLIANINTPLVTLRMTGNEAVINELERDDFRLFVDLEDMAPGIHAVTVGVEHDKVLHELELTPSEVHVTISATNENEEDRNY